MIHSILENIITHTFDEEIKKGHRFDDPELKKTTPSMLLNFHLFPNYDTHQYHFVHIIICGPCNYVYVARQDVLIDKNSKTEIRSLEILGYHDSCWRDGINRFLFDNRSNLCGLRGENLSDWYAQIELSKAEVDYLSEVEDWRRNSMGKEEKMSKELIEKNPFNKRWKKK